MSRISTVCALAAAAALSLTACGQGGSDVAATSSPSAASKAPSTTSAAKPSDAATSVSGGDAPLASDNFDLSGSVKSYPQEQRSGPGATDCYAGGSRIYDRAGVTCAQAGQIKAKYEAMPESAKGDMASVDGYTCSHNPAVMVGQGAAPAKCTDSSGTVVFNWRYPGDPKVG